MSKEYIRSITKSVMTDLTKLTGSDRQPVFGYPFMYFGSRGDHSRCEEQAKNRLSVKKYGYQFAASNKVRVKSLWQPIQKEISVSAHSGHPMTAAGNMESFENHTLIYDQLMKIFASGERFSIKKLKYILMQEYLKKLQHSGEKKSAVQEQTYETIEEEVKIQETE